MQIFLPSQINDGFINNHITVLNEFFFRFKGITGAEYQARYFMRVGIPINIRID